MKILIYTHEFPPFLGGLATTSHKLATGFSEAGLEVTVLAPRYSNKDKELDIEYKFRVKRMIGLSRNHGIPIPIPEIAGLYSLYKAIPKIKPDVLLLITREGHTAGGLLKDYPFKVIIRAAGYEAYRYLLGKKLINRILAKPITRLYNRAAKIICPSNSTRELMLEAAIPENKVKVIYNGVNSEFISKRPEATKGNKIKEQLGIKKNDKILLTISRLVPAKGIESVIKSLPKVIDKQGDLKYIVVGSGKFLGEFYQLADNLGVKSSVIFAGGVPRSEVINYYDLCDIFLIPNFAIKGQENIEGLPNVVIEAAARGKPIITGMPGGGKELIDDGKSGYVVDGENVDEISNRVIELINDKKKLIQFGKRARKRIEEGFTEEIMINKYLNIIYDDGES